MQVGFLEEVPVDNADVSHSGPAQGIRLNGAECPTTKNDDLASNELLLPFFPISGKRVGGNISLKYLKGSLAESTCFLDGRPALAVFSGETTGRSLKNQFFQIRQLRTDDFWADEAILGWLPAFSVHFR